jgi:hypothetical protein
MNKTILSNLYIYYKQALFVIYEVWLLWILFRS